jgi:hypothetical protein
LERHIVAGVTEDRYAVEFFDMTGNTRRRRDAARGLFRLPRQRTDRRVASSANKRSACSRGTPKLVYALSTRAPAGPTVKFRLA